MIDKKSTRLLITGGSGFIGTAAMDLAISEGYTVINFDNQAPRKAAHQEYWQRVDIRDRDGTLRAVEEFSPTHILHLAAMTGMDIKDLGYLSANTDGVRNLIDSTFRSPDLRKTLFTSSLLVCRNGYIPSSDTEYCPPNLYGESKVIGEQLIRSTPMKGDWVIVRPTSIWGQWFEHSYQKFFKVIDRGLYVHPGDIPIVKPLSFVGNTVYMMMRLLLSEAHHGETFYLADYPQHSIQKWGDIIQRCMGKKNRIRVMPISFLRAVAALGDVAKKLGWADPPLTSFRLNNMLTGARYPIEKTASAVGPLPYSMEDGVRQTIQWMREQGQIRYAPAGTSEARCTAEN